MVNSIVLCTHGELGFTNILSQDYVATIQVLVEKILELAEQNNEKSTEILQRLVKVLEEGLAKARAALKKPQLEA